MSYFTNDETTDSVSRTLFCLVLLCCRIVPRGYSEPIANGADVSCVIQQTAVGLAYTCFLNHFLLAGIAGCRSNKFIIHCSLHASITQPIVHIRN